MRCTTLARSAAVAAMIAFAPGCTMKNQDAPDLSGPSELSTSLAVTASPDMLPQDGAAQSVLAVLARDPDNQPIRNLALRVDLVGEGGYGGNFGALSARNITTGPDGRATTMYTAPAGAFGEATPEAIVRIYVTPVGTNLDNAVPRSVAIRLVPPTTIYVPGAPVASFAYSPGNPKAGQDVYFNASGSTDRDGSIVEYQWTYGDGDIEYGVTQTHDFANAGSYIVILTVTDNVGNKASTTRTVVVTE